MTKPKDTPPASGTNVPPEELFEWIETTEANDKPKKIISLTSPLRTLKTIIWSIDWEISDQILMMLNEELNQLKNYYQEDETVLKFLQLMEAVGKYIKKRQGKAHPESVRLLREFFIVLERLVFMLGMSESERKANLQKQIDKFNALKKKLAASRITEAPPTDATSKAETPPINPVSAVDVPSTKEGSKVEATSKEPASIAEETGKKSTPEKKKPAVEKVPAKTEKQISPDTEKQAFPEIKPEILREMLLDEMRLVIRYEFKKIKTELEQMIKNQLPDNQN